ncbi:MAG: HlyD family efflux transporter periplasmic adaptor subunit [Desulfobulbaceae bacterium]|nr:HlyD family efflux transporter periplasmic adaptor subunit [Desulfobulbaceae bacterium]
MKTTSLWQIFPLLLSLTSLTGCTKPSNNHFQGYIEGEFTRVAAPLAGQLAALPVSRGMNVAAGATLFTLEHSLESGGVAEAEQGLARATSQLADLSKGRRPSEIAALEAQLQQALVAQNLARLEFARMEKLLKVQTISRETYDRAEAELKRTAAQIDQLTAELETARLGARADALAAARAEVQAASERLQQARWKPDQKSQSAPQGGLVFDTFYTVGEFVPAGYPVVSLLPPGQIKLRFFVPEIVVGSLKIGRKVNFTFDGDPDQHPATISFVSPQAEYTPPVIYSRETRAQLVFLIEARPEPAEAANLHPGQPVDVRLEPTA